MSQVLTLGLIGNVFFTNELLGYGVTAVLQCTVGKTELSHFVLKVGGTLNPERHYV